MSIEADFPVGGVYTLPAPETYCPFPLVIAPYLKDIEDYSFQVAERYGLAPLETPVQRLFLLHMARFIPYVWPYASLEVLKVIAEWIIPFFYYDDEMENIELASYPELILTHNARVMQVLRTPALPPQGPFAEALAVFWAHATALTEPPWQKRFTLNFKNYMDRYTWQAQHVRERVPDFESYLVQRRQAAAAYPCFDLMNLELGFDLPEPVHEHPILVQIRQMTADILAWVNDLFSFPKEMADGQATNLVLVLRERGNGSLQEAVDRMCQLIADQSTRFLEQKKYLPSFSPPIDQQVQTYVEYLQAMMAGNLYYSLANARYPQPNDTIGKVEAVWQHRNSESV